MKLTRKLIPAMIMLLVSAVLMSTASFAWFAMNDTVTATGMKVTAKSDAVFLQISGDDGSTYDYEYAHSDPAKELLPVAHDSFGSKADIQPSAGKWFYQYSNNKANSAADSVFGKNVVAEGNFENYVYKLTYKFKLAADSASSTAYDLHVSSISLPATEGVKVIVEGPDGYYEFEAADTDGIAWGETGATVLANTVAKSGETEVNVYIYIDGANTNVTTDKLDASFFANLDPVDIGFKVYTQDHT